MADWLLVETFGDQAPSIIGTGNRPRRWATLDKLRNKDQIREILASDSPEPVDLTLANGRRRLRVDPLRTFDGTQHGAWVWSAASDEEPPAHDLAGAWYFNFTTDAIGGSSDLLDIYRQPPEERHQQRRTAEAFTRLATNDDVADAFAIIVKSGVGAEHQAVWTVHCDDGEDIAAHFSCRSVRAANGDIVLRGVTHDLGPATSTEAASGPVALERRVLDAVAEPGTCRALVNIRTGNVIRWEDPPPQELDWTSLEHSLVHPDDEGLLKALHDGLTDGRSEQTLRLHTTNGSDAAYRVVAYPVLLDADTTAAFWTIYYGA